MPDQVSFLHSSGGLLTDAVLAELRSEAPSGPAARLAKPSTFQGREGDAPSRGEFEEDLEFAYRRAEASWGVLADRLDTLDTSRLRERLLLPLLRELGFDPRFQAAHLIAADNNSYAITHLGWDGADAPPLIVVTQDLDERRGRARSPHQELQGYLNATPARWGLAANAREIRILRDYHHTSTQGAIIIDLADLLAAGSFPDFRAFFRLGHASRFQPPQGEEGPQFDHTLLEELYQESLSEGVAVGRALQPQVRRALTALLNGVLTGTPQLRSRLREEPAFGREVYRELLTVLYRTLFLLFAEQRGLLDGAHPLYSESYSVSRLRDLAERRTPEPRRGDLWEGLKATFTAFSGDEAFADALGVYPYDGELFDLDRTPHLSAAGCPNSALLDAMRAMTTITLGQVRQYVDFRHLGVEELGTVYESLLGYTIRVADAFITVDGEAYSVGQAYLAPLSTERAELGAYYTPSKLVDLVLSRSLDPLIADRLEAAGTDSAARERALLDLRIIDPACGSAAFLVAVIDRLAVELADIRAGQRQPTDYDVQIARREVLEHCIYAADADPFAVELAKVALWIHCAVRDMPLNFLDHKVVRGDSLVGWPLISLPREIPDKAYDPPSWAKGDARRSYQVVGRRNRAYLARYGGATADEANTLALEFLPRPEVDLHLPEELRRPETSVADVRDKARALARFRDSPTYRSAKCAANLWTAAFFWSPEFGDFPTSSDYHAALDGDGSEWRDELQQLLKEIDPLHWALAFPDIRARGGFDLVVGNPPWEKFVTPERAFFTAAGRDDIADLTSADRKIAIAELAEGTPDDRQLWERWNRHQQANARMSAWAKNSGRFTPTSGEVNTYLLFAELAAELSAERGVVGQVLKSGIAIDQRPAPVWQALLDSGRLREIIDIVNGGRAGQRAELVFPAVAAVERFCMLTLGPPRPTNTAFAATMLCWTLDEAAVKEPTLLTAEAVVATAPETRTLLSAPDKEQYQLAVELHRKLPILGLEDGSNPWEVTYIRLFDSSTDSQLFLRKEDLEDSGWWLGEDKIFRHPDGRVALPVLEGQLIRQFDHRAKSYEYYTGTNVYGRKPNVPETPDEDKVDPDFEAEPRYWMVEEEAHTRLEAKVGPKALVAFRKISRPWTDQRSFKVALISRYPATDGLPTFTVPAEHALEFLGIINSTAFDFLARTHLPGANLEKWVLSQVAVPRPGQDPRIAELAGRLSVTSRRLAEAYDLPLHRWNPDRRERDQAELDALVAKTAYRLDRSAYELVLDTFDVLRRKQEERYGEYRFRRLCLEAYDRI